MSQEDYTLRAVDSNLAPQEACKSENEVNRDKRDKAQSSSVIKKQNKQKPALAGVAQWIECQPANQKVTVFIPSQSTCLSCGPGP